MRYLFLSLALFTTITFAKELSTNNMQEVEKTVLEKVKKYGAKNVLVVFDIDNTLITMSQSFGSDQWFNWQFDNCVAQKPKQDDICVANNMDDLLSIQAQIYALSNAVPTQAGVPTVIQNIQKTGARVITLTSRGSEMRNSTLRTLNLNGFDFSKSSFGPKPGYAGTYSPYMLNAPQSYGLSKNEVAKYKLGSPRPVSFVDGVYMTSGQHKGVMLKNLLHKTGKSFKAIIFADDHQKHTSRMQDVYGKNKKIDLTTYRYGAVDHLVKSFNESDKSEAIEAWKTLKQASLKVFK